MGLFLPSFLVKKKSNSTNANSCMDGDILFDIQYIFMKSINW
jgi:hypothetical protein